jgi:hypothetical protein
LSWRCIRRASGGVFFPQGRRKRAIDDIAFERMPRAATGDAIRPLRVRLTKASRSIEADRSVCPKIESQLIVRSVHVSAKTIALRFLSLIEFH